MSCHIKDYIETDLCDDSSNAVMSQYYFICTDYLVQGHFFQILTAETQLGATDAPMESLDHKYAQSWL